MKRVAESECGWKNGLQTAGQNILMHHPFGQEHQTHTPKGRQVQDGLVVAQHHIAERDLVLAVWAVQQHGFAGIDATAAQQRVAVEFGDATPATCRCHDMDALNVDSA